ncbi:MAG: hypothetical protein ACM3O9_02365 [Methylocystaceae bacterium]
MNKHLKWTVAFCCLSTASLTFAQATKSSVIYAPIIGWSLGIIFTLLAVIRLIKSRA